MTTPTSSEQRVLVVCFGNICRSPVAEALLRERLEGAEWTVESAGVGAVDGAPASRLARSVLEAETGIDIETHRSQRLTPALIEGATHLLTMSIEQAMEISSLVPHAADRVRLLGAFAPDPKSIGPADPGGPIARPDEIPDPMGGGLETYLECHRRLEYATGAAAAWLKRGAPTEDGPPSVASPRWPHV